LLFRRGINSYTYTAAGEVKGFQPNTLADAYYNNSGTLMMATISDSEINYFYRSTQSGRSTAIARQTVSGPVDFLYRGTDGFYSLFNRTLHVTTQSGITSTKIHESIKYSLFSATPIISKSSSHVAFFNGNDYFLGSAAGDGRPIDESDPLRDASISIYAINSLSTGKIHATIELAKTRDISGILLSPSSTKLAVIHDKRLAVYDIETAELIMNVPLSTNLRNVFWIDDDSVVLRDSSFILYQVNTVKKEAHSILASNTIRVSDICGIKDNILYFIGFDSTQDGSQRVPSGFYVNLSN
jgi:hypothetical protein